MTMWRCSILERELYINLSNEKEKSTFSAQDMEEFEKQANIDALKKTINKAVNKAITDFFNESL